MRQRWATYYFVFFLLFIISQNSLYSSLKINEAIISPKIGIQWFKSDLLSEFYERDKTVAASLDLELVSNLNNIGLFTKLKMMKFTIPNEKYSSPIDLNLYWFTFGIEKVFIQNHIIFTPMIGYTIHGLLYYDSIESQTNLHANINLKYRLLKKIGLAADMGYEYSRIDQGKWIHSGPARDEMMVDQNYERGGFFINIGLFYSIKNI